MSKQRYLSKLSPSQVKYKYLNFYCDFETVVLNEQHYVTCYSIIGENVKMYNILKLETPSDLNNQSDNLISEFIYNCIKIVKNKKDKKLHYLFFFHNLNKFDSYFLLKRLSIDDYLNVRLVSRNNQIYKIIIKEKNSDVFLEFRDTLLYLPFSLDKISEIFCKVNMKRNFNHEDNQVLNYIDNLSFQDKLLDYCINDSVVLQEGFENFLNYIRVHLNIEPLKSLSLPSISLYYFRLKFYNDLKFPIEKLSKNKDSFIRKSYRGGIVDLFKPHLVNGFHYDVNSLYPYVMKSFCMPIGIGKWVDNISNINDFFGFVKVEVTSPSDMHKPFLNYYDNNLGLISPLGTWTEVYFSEEIKYALTLGYKFKYIKGISYEKGIIFDELIDHLYNLRLNFDKGTPLNTLLKLLMNSLYGKFGMKLDTTESKLINLEEIKEYVSIYDVKNLSILNSKALITMEKEPIIDKLNSLLVNQFITIDDYLKFKNIKPNFNNNSAVQIASAITAYARIEIDKFKRDPNLDVYYSDTDSIFCQNAISSKYISDTELGKLKLENRIKEAIFLCPKVYMVKNFNDETIIKCKGLNNQKLTDEDIYSVYFNSTNSIKKFVSNFIRDFRTLTIFKKEKKFEISTVLNKRKKIIINGKWVDTNPLKI